MDDATNQELLGTLLPSPDFVSLSKYFKLGWQPNEEIMTSPIFTITAKSGGQDQLFVHQAVLEKSPVFKAMCNRPFKEGISRHIDLPEDDFHQISCLLQFLYTTGDSKYKLLYPANEDHAPAAIKAAVSFGAQLYALAHKYEVKKLEAALASDIVDMCDPPSMKLTLIHAARFIYDNVPSLQSYFRHHFKRVVEEMFCNKGRLGCSDLEMEEIMKDGGQVAADIFQAQGEGLERRYASHNRRR